MNDMVKSFSQELALHQKSFSSVLPSHIEPKKFMRTVVGAVQNNPDILKCDRNSIFTACQKAAQDGLLLDGREAALAKFKTKINGQYVQAAQYMPMVAGLLKKLRNSGQLLTITAQAVHANDAFKYNPAVDEVPNHNPDWFGERGKFIGVYAVAKLKGGGTVVELMNMEQINKVKSASKSSGTGPWSGWFEEMAKKSVLRRIAKYLPSSADIDQIMDHDNETYTVSDDTETAEVVDMTPNTRAATIVGSAVNTDTGEIIDPDDSVVDSDPI